ILFFGFYFYLGSAPDRTAEAEIFVVPENAELSATVKRLGEQGFYKSGFAFRLALTFRGGGISPGGYEISRAMSASTLAKVLSGEPSLEWVRIPEGVRKEQIFEIFQKRFGWTEAEEAEFLAATRVDSDYREGVYF